VNSNSLTFNVGDVLIDDINGDIGILIRRYMLFDETEADIYENIIVWDIYWSATYEWPFDDHIHCYTEDGLAILVNSGVLTLHKSI
tara:strand:- start:4683 stop:4940 length:258 start_codon:yes stop_codon:yes gene_type:complete